jgi:hypothetical protein
MAQPLGGQRLTILTIAYAIVTAPASLTAQITHPCDVITKAEAEAIVGGPLIGPQPSPKGALCNFYENGYGDSPSKIKLVTIGVWNEAPDPDAVNNRRLAVMRDSSLLPLKVRELSGPGDAAIWVWAGNRLGALYAFRNGTTEVAVKISGAKQDAALAAAKRIAAHALGSASKSSYVYIPEELQITFDDFYAPRILSSLYLGTLNQIADDPLTRGYILTLGQAFNGICPSVPNSLALVEYGYGQPNMFKSAQQGNMTKFLHDFVNNFSRAQPRMPEIARGDAEAFIASQLPGMTEDMEVDPNDCMTPEIERLYNNIGRLAQQRQSMKPDVEDDYSFYMQLSPEGQKQVGFNPRTPRVVTAAQVMKKGCSTHSASLGPAAEMESFCRCMVEAALVAHVPDDAMRSLGASFDLAKLDVFSARYPAFGFNKKACYH